MGAATDAGQVILDEIAALEVERARVEAKISSRMLAFQDVARAEAEKNTDPRVRDLEASFAAEQLGAVLHQPTKIVQDRLAQTRRVRNLLPSTWLAHLSGRIDAYRVSLIAAAADKVRGNNHHLIHLDAIITAYAQTHTTAQLKGKLNRFVATYAPTGAAKAERARRYVSLTHGDDGMSHLHAYIPTPDAIRIHAQLTATAKTGGSVDGRTFEQRRADAFIAQMRGTLTGQTISSRAVIGITIPCTSLAGFSDEPGQSWDGTFALPADVVRGLAAEPGTLFHRVITDPLGRVLDITELGRFPSHRLRIAIDIRDGTCRLPACNLPAIDCDIDHEIPHPRGPTAASNLRGLCRRHHNLKTAGITEPTTLTMDTHRPSAPEHDFASFAVRWTYAA